MVRVDLLDERVHNVVHRDVARLLLVHTHVLVLDTMAQRLVKRLVQLDPPQLLAVLREHELKPEPHVLAISRSGRHTRHNNVTTKARHTRKAGELVMRGDVHVDSDEPLLGRHSIEFSVTHSSSPVCISQIALAAS